jgi:adenosylhomocysteine nucleosidase
MINNQYMKMVVETEYSVQHMNDNDSDSTSIVVVISADIEWEVIKNMYPSSPIKGSPMGEWLEHEIDINGVSHTVVFFHGGWGKIAAAASTQYIIDRWDPELIVNLGTCGGFEGEIEKGEIILVDKTVVYDIYEQMTGREKAIDHYTTKLDLGWLIENYPQNVSRKTLVSGDRDLIPQEIPTLKELYGAVAGDWESGAIAYTATRNRTKCLILRGVTDLVGPSGGEAYKDLNLYIDGTKVVLEKLAEALPKWLEIFLTVQQ